MPMWTRQQLIDQLTQNDPTTVDELQNAGILVPDINDIPRDDLVDLRQRLRDALSSGTAYSLSGNDLAMAFAALRKAIT